MLSFQNCFRCESSFHPLAVCWQKVAKWGKLTAFNSNRIFNPEAQDATAAGGRYRFRCRQVRSPYSTQSRTLSETLEVVGQSNPGVGLNEVEITYGQVALD